MECIKLKMFMNCFALLCGLLTVSLCSYWCYQYSLNDDLSVVRYKEFQVTNDDIYPTASFCLGNPFLKKKLTVYGVNDTAYLDFLRGTSFTKGMLNINFSDVTIDITDYIKGYELYFKNETGILFTSDLTLQQKTKLTYTSFIGFGYDNILYKCFALEIPSVIDLSSMRILLSNEIFPNGMRPTTDFLTTFTHSSKQFLLSKNTERWVWPYRSNDECYTMWIHVHGVDVVMKRDKKQQPCNKD